MHTRDIPFDEECPERSDHYRETCGPGLSADERAQARAKVRAMFDEADRLAARERVANCVASAAEPVCHSARSHGASLPTVNPIESPRSATAISLAQP